jgi:hypothetical protein
MGPPWLWLCGVLLWAGCATSGLRFVPEGQPSGVPVSADYAVAGDRLRILIDSGGYRVEDAWIIRLDDRMVEPRSIEHPSFRQASDVGLGVGVGVAGGSGGWSGGGGFGVTFVPGRGVLGAGEADRLTVALFALDEAGPPPWRLRLKVVGTPLVDIVLDPASKAN